MKIDLKHKPIGMKTMLLSLKFIIFVIWKENSVFKQIRYQDVELKRYRTYVSQFIQLLHLGRTPRDM